MSSIGNTEAKASDVSMKLNNGDGENSSNVQTKTNLEFSRQDMKCTDYFCLAFFILYLVGMLVVMAIAMTSGDPNRLIYGTDYMGSTCGSGPNEQSITKKLVALGSKPADIDGTYFKETSWAKYFQNRKDITYPRTNIDLLVKKLTTGPVGVIVGQELPTLPNFYGLCVSKCPVARHTVDVDYIAKKAAIKKMINSDVVCSIQASVTIQKVCHDATFRTKMGTDDNITNILSGVLVDNNVNISDANKEYRIGQVLSAGYGRILPWFTIPDEAADAKEAILLESQCLTQFYDRCSGLGAERCKKAGASQAALDAVENDCWQQKVNSLSVINRCVASRNVEMEVVCSDPVKTTPMRCRKDSKLVTTDGSILTKEECEGLFANGTRNHKLTKKGEFGCDTTASGPRKETEYDILDPDNHLCWNDETGHGKGKWLVNSYNNTGSVELTPDQVAAQIEPGDASVSSPGYCAASTTVTKSIYGVGTNKLFEWLNNAGKIAAGWFADFKVTRTCILVTGIVLSTVLAFGWIWFMKKMAYYVCWTTLILSLMTVIALNLCLYVKAGIIGQDILGGIAGIVAKKNPELADQIPNSFPDYLQPSETRKSLYKWSAMAMTVFILIALVAMVRFRQKINVAIQMCKEAAQAIIAMPLIVFWPFLNVLLLVIVFVYFIFIAMFIASSANLQNINQDLKQHYNDNVKRMQAAGNKAIDYGNAAGTAATAQYMKTDAENRAKYGFGNQDWNAVQHMHYNATTVQPLNFDANKAIRGLLAYHTVGMWWISLVVVTVGHYTVAAAVSSWYFNRGAFLKQSINRAAHKYDKKMSCGCCQISCDEVKESPITDACKKGCRYHVGSFAKGAALNIAVVFLKFAFLWINKLVHMITGNNTCARKIKACMFVAMGLFDRFLRIISRNAYIMMAIRGQNFCQSASWASWLIFAAQDNPKNLDEGHKDLEKHRKARVAFNKKQAKNIEKLKKISDFKQDTVFTSISFVSGGEVEKEVKIPNQKAHERQLTHETNKLTSYEGPYKSQSYNAAQYAVLSLITDILLFLGKLVVVVSAGIMAYIWINIRFKVGELTSSAAPIAVAMLFSYFIVAAFMSVYEMSIDTILLCFFYDKLQNKGGPYAMSPALKKLVLANLPPGTNKSNMRKGDSFFFSQQVTNRGSISIGAGWDAEQSAPTGKAGQKSAAQMSTAASYVKNPAIDIDLAMCVFDKDAKLLDYIGYMEAVKPNGEMAMTLKSSTGGNLFADAPNKSLSNINAEACVWSGDDKNGATSNTNVAGLNEDITVRLHEMPINVDTLAFVMFSFKGPCFNEISDLRLFATECTQSTGAAGRQPEVVAKFNCDFDKESLEGAQQALLCVTLRRNPGPKFPKGTCNWDAGQKAFARKFASEPIKGDNYKAYLAKHIEARMSELGLGTAEYNSAKARVDALHEDEYDQILNSEKKAKGRQTRSMFNKIQIYEERVAADVIFYALAIASKKKGCELTAQQLMVWNRTYSAFNAGPGVQYTKGCDAHGDMCDKEEDFFDCAWEIQAQRELMGMKKFNASCINSIARKCFFFREAQTENNNKFGKANGSYCGAAVSSSAAFLATA